MPTYVLYTNVIPCPFDLKKNVLQDQKCHSTSKGDGRWNEQTGRFEQYPCSSKNCPRHWKRYGIQRYASIMRSLQPRRLAYHVRLSCGRRIMKGEKFQALNKFLEKIKLQIPDAEIFWTCHRNRAGHHFHVGLSTDVYHDDDIKELVVKAWAAHFPAKRTKTFKPSFVYCKEFDKMKKLLWYTIFGTRKHPRRAPPWKGVPMRCPVKYVRRRRLHTKNR